MGSKGQETALLGGVVVLVAALSLWAANIWSPPDPAPASAPADRFSAERALGIVEDLEGLRPVGSPAHASARDYLVRELADLGFEAQVQETTETRRLGDDRFLAVRVRNVVARRRGSDSSGGLLLMAHYDSRPNTYGAGDDLSGVAAILETLRALAQSAEPLANDLLVLISDAEELGLFGARAFVARHPWAAEVSLVLNFEGRGNRGPAMMFETREGNLEVVSTLATVAPHPFANSISYEVYRRMPNDTDFTVFREAGVQGLNTAFIGNYAAYHTLLDSASSLSPGTLQHLGGYALALTRHFSSVDLEAFERAGGEDGVYFNPYPWRLVVYRASSALPAAVLVTAVLLVAILLGWRRDVWSVAGLARGAILFPLALFATGALGWSLWWLFRNYLGRALFGPYGLPYETGSVVFSLALLAAATLGALAAWLSGRASLVELYAGSWVGWAAIGLVLAWFVAGASFLVAWPLLFAALGLMGVGLGAADSRSAPLWLALASLPAVWILAPTAWTMTQALSLHSSAVVGVLLGLLLLPIAPHLGRLHELTGGKSSLMLSAAAVAMLAWVFVVARPTAERPAVNTLAYALDSETGEAWWASFDQIADDWTAEKVGELQQAPSAFSLGDTEVLLGPADAAALTGPTLETLSDSRAAGRRVEGLVRSTRGASVLRIRAETSVPLRGVTIEGESFLFEGEAEGIGEVWITAYGFGESGLRVGFHVDEAWPIELDLVDQSPGFELLPDPPEPRPAHLIPSSSWRTDAVYVQSTALL
jgi:hypothetical protein